MISGMIPRDGASSFLAAAGWAGADIRPLAGDASFRRYFRVHDRGRQAVLMDAPPLHEDVGPFLAIANHLASGDFSAPRLMAADRDNGFLLIEDFGDRRMADVLKTEPELEDRVYAQAIELLAELHRTPLPQGLRPYDRAELTREVLLFPQYYLKAAGVSVDTESYLACWDQVWADVLAETAVSPVLVLRDYHAENLMLLADRTGFRALGLLDFQDALAGHPAYDVVSLLQDARRDVSPRLERRMIDHFVTLSGLTDATRFRAAYEVLGAQRNTKILGIFVRLRDRDGKSGYVERLPRVWGYLERNLAHPALAPVREWFDRQVPQPLRKDWCH